MTASTGSIRWRHALPLVLLTLLWLSVFLSFAHLSGGPQGAPFGSDFTHIMSSAYVMAHGGNPYDGDLLARTEHLYMQSHGVAHFKGSSDPKYVWAGYPPLFVWALGPLTRYPFPQVAMGWIVVLCALMAAGFFLYIRSLGWSMWLLPTLLFLGMPQTTYQAYFANPAGLVVALIMAALAIHRRWPLLAGVLLSLTWLKPQLGLLSFVLIALCQPQRYARIVAGFALGTLGLVGLTFIGPGAQSLVFWLKVMFSVSGTAGQQPNMIPLVGLYAGWTSPATHTVIEFLTICVALGLTAWWRWQVRGIPDVPFQLVAWLWPVWILALPYAHFPDEMLLVPAVIAVIGQNGREITGAIPTLCVYLLYCSTLLYSAQIGQVQLLWLPLLIMAIALYRNAARRLRAQDDAALEASPNRSVNDTDGTASLGLRMGA